MAPSPTNKDENDENEDDEDTTKKPDDPRNRKATGKRIKNADPEEDEYEWNPHESLWGNLLIHWRPMKCVDG